MGGRRFPLLARTFKKSSILHRITVNFVPGPALISFPLTDLLRGKATYLETEEERARKLFRHPTLFAAPAPPDLGKPFFLEADMSAKEAAAMLSWQADCSEMA